MQQNVYFMFFLGTPLFFTILAKNVLYQVIFKLDPQYHPGLHQDQDGSPLHPCHQSAQQLLSQLFWFSYLKFMHQLMQRVLEQNLTIFLWSRALSQKLINQQKCIYVDIQQFSVVLIACGDHGKLLLTLQGVYIWLYQFL